MADDQVTITAIQITKGESYSKSDMESIASAVDLQIPATLGGKPVVALGNGDVLFSAPFSTEDNYQSSTYYAANNAFNTVKTAELTAQRNAVKLLTIPASVTTVGASAFSSLSNCESVTFATGSALKTVGLRAFADCTKISTIALPAGVTSIGSSAFTGCSALASVTIPDNVTTIGQQAFSGSGLTSVTIPGDVATIEEGAFGKCKSLETVTLSEGLATIGRAAFSECSALKAITIPASVTSISNDGDTGGDNGGSSFYGCTSLTTVTFAEGSKLEALAGFNKCSALTEVKGIPATVKKVDALAFLETGITSLALPDSVTEIGTAAFSGSKLESFTIPAGVTSLGYRVFEKTPLKSIEIPAAVESMAGIQNFMQRGTFNGCTSLTTVTFAEGSKLKTLDGFAGCTSLTSIVLPSTVEKVEASAFDGCSALKDIVLPDTVKELGASAFANCTSLTHINIPASLATSGNTPFKKCSGITSVTLGKGVKHLPSFSGTKLAGPFEIPSTVESVGASFLMGTEVTSVKMEGNPFGTAIPEATFKNCASLTAFEVPKGVTAIGKDAFSGCASLTAFEVPESVTAIGDNAFYKCVGLNSVVIPDAVTSVGSSLFQGCTTLAKASIGRGVSASTKTMFSGCGALEDLYLANPKFDTAANNWLKNVSAELNIHGWDVDGSTAKALGESTANQYEFVPFAVIADYEVAEGVTAKANYSVSVSPEAVAYSPAGTKPAVAVTPGEGMAELAEGDYSVACMAEGSDEPLEALAGAGKYTVTVAGNEERYVFGTATAIVTVEPASISGAKVTAEDAQLEADGVPVTTKVTVELDGQPLVEGDDYELTYEGNDQPGTAKVTAKGKGNYAGEAAAEFQVAAAPEPEPEPAIELDEGENDVQGDTRFGTAAAIALKAFPAGADAVVVANGFSYADALAASSLAGALDAPIVTVGAGSVPNETLAAIRALGATKAYVVGGEAVVSGSVAAQLEAITGSKVTRVSGSDRYGTALEIYEQGKASWGGTCVVAYGWNFADAVSVSPYANQAKAPIFLTDGSTLSSGVQAAVKGFERVVIVGGEAVVSPAVESQLKSLVGGANVVRLAGDDRYETSAKVASWMVAQDGFELEGLALATGAAASGGADALAGGVLQGRLGSVLLLTGTDDVPGATAEFLAAAKGRTASVTYLGGESAISKDVRAKVNAALGLAPAGALQAASVAGL